MDCYYSERIERDTKYRGEYADSIETFLSGAKAAADREREAFMTPESYGADPEKYRRAFVEMLGFPLNGPAEMPTCEQTFVAADGNVDIYRMQFAFPSGVKFYGMYFRQRENTGAAPFVIATHGGEGTPEMIGSIHSDSANYNHLARRLTDRGCNVFAPQLLLWKVEKYGNPYARWMVNSRLRQLGGSVTALELHLIRGCINWFIRQGEANPDRLGSAGLSYGGMYALLLAAADVRIRSCFSCSWFADRYVYAKEDWSYRDALRTFSDGEMAALVAPRRLVVAMGSHDEMFRSCYTLQEGKRTAAFYRQLGAAQELKVYEFFGLHETDRGDDGLSFFLTGLQQGADR